MQAISTPTPSLLTAEDVAGILGVRPQYISGLARKGQISTVRLGKYVRLRATAIEEWIALRVVGGTMSEALRLAHVGRRGSTADTGGQVRRRRALDTGW